MNFQPGLGGSRRQAKTRFRKSGEAANGRHRWAGQAPDRETREGPAQDLRNKGVGLSPAGREQHPPSLIISFARLLSFTSIPSLAPSPQRRHCSCIGRSNASRVWSHNARPLPRTENAASAHGDHDCRNTHANTRGDDTSRHSSQRTSAYRLVQNSNTNIHAYTSRRLLLLSCQQVLVLDHRTLHTLCISSTGRRGSTRKERTAGRPYST